MSEWTKERHESLKRHIDCFRGLNPDDRYGLECHFDEDDASDALSEIERLQAEVESCYSAMNSYRAEVDRMKAEVDRLKDGEANTTACPTCHYIGKPGEVITIVDGKVCVVPCPDCNTEAKP